MRSIDCLEHQNIARCTTGVGVLKAMPHRITSTLKTNSLSLKKVSLFGEASPMKRLSTLFPAAYTGTELL